MVIWHLLDPPRTDSAMAAALPTAALPAWRLYLGLPLTGRRLPAGGSEEMMRLGLADPVLNLFRPADAEALECALASRYRDRSRVRLHREPGMPHHLAEPPGVEPAPQTAHAAAVDAAFTSWFTEHLTSPAH